MRYLLTYAAKGLDHILYGMNWLFDICALVHAIGCISTWSYRTAHRQIWGVFLGSLNLGIIVYFLLNLVVLLLLEFSKMEDIIKFFSHKKIEERKALLVWESKIYPWVYFPADIAGRIMIGWYIQSFTGDPWWASVYQTTFTIIVLFFLNKFVQIKICENVLRRSA